MEKQLVITDRENNTINFVSPIESNMSMDEFVSTMQNLTELSLKNDKTIVRRSPEQLKKYYNHTLFLEISGVGIIGKSSILPTDKLQSPVIIENREISVGETTGTLIIPEYRGSGYGSLLVEQTESSIGKSYDVILGGTINQLMATIRTRRGYEIVDFPEKLYEEGKNFFSPMLVGGEKEFAEKAKCLVRFGSDIDEKTKTEFLNLFSNL